ncbi:MAG TPA: magnesium-transporting ATPase, partial [Synergistetes bacterium]|nr:magnesium-transporting ATPase [Synergistota bacterium]
MTEKMEAWSLPTEDILSRLGVDPAKGLDGVSVTTLQERYGPNQIDPEEPQPWWKNLLKQFLTPMVYLLAGATIISIAVGEFLDAGAILVVILLNAIIGFVTEFRAEKALHALRAMISPVAVALRDGKVQTVNAACLVPGDLILLEAGDVVPADARVFEQFNLAV